MSQPLRARAILLALTALFVTAAVLPPLDRIPAGNTIPSGAGDNTLFAAVVARVGAGDEYYPTMGSELRKRNYPTGSVFNWRTPVLFELMALAPPQTYRPALLVLSAIALALTVIHLNRLKATEEVLVGILALIGVSRVILAPAITFQTEGWAGVLIAISALTYERRAWQTSALIGIAALFVRELAAPYCVVCVLLAAKAKRTRELIIWIAGGAAYCVFYWLHVLQVRAQYHPGDRGHLASWIQFGGLRFLMETIRESNSILLLVPYALSACVVTLLAAALWASTIPTHVKGSVIAYALFFAVVGQSFNDYWGLTAAPIQAVALAYGPIGLRVLVTRAVGRSHDTAPPRPQASDSRQIA